MTKYIALLRAINVGGHTVKMEKLRELFSELSLHNVRTYIQTGNVFFETKENDKEVLQHKIESYLHKTLGYEVPTCIRSINELENAIKLNPFKNIELTPETRHCIAFVTEKIKGLEVPFVSPKNDWEIISSTGSELFVIIHIKPGKVPNIATYIEKTFNTRITVRFYHTAIKILEAAQRS